MTSKFDTLLTAHHNLWLKGIKLVSHPRHFSLFLSVDCRRLPLATSVAPRHRVNKASVFQPRGAPHTFMLVKLSQEHLEVSWARSRKVWHTGVDDVFFRRSLSWKAINKPFTELISLSTNRSRARGYMEARCTHGHRKRCIITCMANALNTHKNYSYSNWRGTLDFMYWHIQFSFDWFCMES